MLGTAWADDFTFQADHYTTNLETRLTRGQGNVKVELGEGQRLSCDEIEINGKDGQLKARGHVVYEKGLMTVRGESVDLDTRTGFGTFQNAVLKVKDGFSVQGRELGHYAEGRYRAVDGKLTTCQDCPPAWSITGAWMDLEVEGYAEIHHALFQIHDQPVAYVPVFYFPVKTKRQSGLLVPQIVQSPRLGFQLTVPYFWATSDNSDFTFNYDYMSRGGNRLGTEFRFLSSDRSFAQGRASFLRNHSVLGMPDDRYGYSISERWQISPEVTQRYQGELAGDPFYANDFPNDFNGNLLPTLVNQPSLSWQKGGFFSYALLRLNRDNLPRYLNNETLGSIQRLPELGLVLPSTQIWGPLRGSTGLEWISFHRRGGPVDPGTGWIRTGDRGTWRSRLSAPVNLFSYLDWNPSVETRVDNYTFHAPGVPEQAARARVFFDQKLSTEISKVYQLELGTLKALKHTVTPSVRWSYAPHDALTSHPFFAVKRDALGQPLGTLSQPPRFDIFDPNSDASTVTLGTLSEEQRLGFHHLLTLGVSTRILGRFGEGSSKTVDELFGGTVNRDFNLLTQELGRIHISLYGQYVGMRLSTEMNIDTRSGNSDFRNEASYSRDNYAAGIFQSITSVQRNYGANAAIKNIKGLALTASATYDAIIHRVQDQSYSIGFNSGSKCWGAMVTIFRPPGQTEFSRRYALSLVLSEGKNGF